MIDSRVRDRAAGSNRASYYLRGMYSDIYLKAINTIDMDREHAG